MYIEGALTSKSRNIALINNSEMKAKNLQFYFIYLTWANNYGKTQKCDPVQCTYIIVHIGL